MIECELCGNYIDEDDLKECQECLKEMCEQCYERHDLVYFYVSESDYMDTYDEQIIFIVSANRDK